MNAKQKESVLYTNGYCHNFDVTGYSSVKLHMWSIGDYIVSENESKAVATHAAYEHYLASEKEQVASETETSRYIVRQNSDNVAWNVFDTVDNVQVTNSFWERKHAIERADELNDKLAYNSDGTFLDDIVAAKAEIDELRKALEAERAKTAALEAENTRIIDLATNAALVLTTCWLDWRHDEASQIDKYMGLISLALGEINPLVRSYSATLRRPALEKLEALKALQAPVDAVTLIDSEIEWLATTQDKLDSSLFWTTAPREFRNPLTPMYQGLAGSQWWKLHKQFDTEANRQAIAKRRQEIERS